MKDLNFANGDYIEAKLDLTELSRAKQNILSIGENISIWNTQNDGTYNLHFYFPNTKTDRRLRFSTVIGEKVNGLSRRTKGILSIPDESNLIIRFDKNGFYINGTLINLNDYEIEDDQPANTYAYFMQHFQSSISTIQVGSLEGSTRTWATYEYIMYHRKL